MAFWFVEHPDDPGHLSVEKVVGRLFGQSDIPVKISLITPVCLPMGCAALPLRRGGTGSMIVMWLLWATELPMGR